MLTSTNTCFIQVLKHVQPRKINVRLLSTKTVDAMVDDIFSLRSYSSISSSLSKELTIYSTKKQTPVSLRALMETGKGDKLRDINEILQKNKSMSDKVKADQLKMISIQVACFLHRELPVRLAHMAVKLEALPIFLKSGKSFNSLKLHMNNS